MKIIRVDNPEVTTVTSSLLENIEYNSTELSVNNIEDFNINDILLLENVGYELCEIVYITNITDKLIVTSTQYSHKSGILITKLNYDKYKIMRATSEVTDKILIKEGNINYADVYNCIYYIDNTYDASDSLYYYVYYINSITETETLASTLHNENNYGYISVSNFRAETSFTSSEISDSEIEKAIFNGVEYIRDMYRNQEFTGNQDTIFTIDTKMEFADNRGDNIIDKYDIIVFEYDLNTAMRTYLSHKILKIIPASKKIIFKENVPLNPNNQLIFQIPLTFKTQEDIKQTLATVNKLVATNWILQNVDTSKIKSGITSWNAGGVSVNRDVNNIRESVDKNLKLAKYYLERINKTYIEPTKLRSRYSDLNRRYTSGINSRFFR